MKPTAKAYLLREGGKIASDIIRVVAARPRKPEVSTKRPEEEEAAVLEKPTSTITSPTARPELPTTEETAAMLKRRLAKEVYKAELDLAGGLLIAGKPCDCLTEKHALFLEATAEELIPQDPSNTVYTEILRWLKDNGHKVTIEAIAGGEYKDEYPGMSAEFRGFRKRLMGTTSLTTMIEPRKQITLDEAKNNIEGASPNPGSKALVKIKTTGDSTFSPGSLVSRAEYDAEVERIRDFGGKPPTLETFLPEEGGEWIYVKVGSTEMRGRKGPIGIEFEQVSVTYDRNELQKAVEEIERKIDEHSLTAMIEPRKQITLNEAKKLAADEAAKEVGRRWYSQEKKPAT